MAQLTAYISFLLSILGLALNRTHLVSALLCLEGMTLALFIMLTTLSLNTNLSTTSIAPMLLLAFSACEASTGLALLVASSRTHSSDHLKNLNLLQC
uniref:NADH dehydrogenase subunit 4L n=1 Tax=Hoplodactylus duvaucelii TaxID=927625 RepID=UPI002000B625|nr:NADH dehydrogenase subunit 4L [Hoplodactylus duvaucelii]UNQ32362.1 NADH dehydrogenase subunit 4L [Hoplodactylus duvaucelii]UNQ32375.1 NADH dehydrogenase subunit 4L [Hoplodactylus duvaucelii]UNQ32388.1 NADH dehydrogenase subunit 4L [Hoplodactylus duvaucelii]UNQ32401.1 NADH dehydrogenase subunit 4L [Hoplodactylus duvaucelii]